MGDDWQDAAFSNRYLHNRNDKSGRAGNRVEFDVRNTFGTHIVKCPAIEGLRGQGRGGGGGEGGDKGFKPEDVVLEIYRLTDSQDGMLGSLRSRGCLDAMVVFAGSRKGLGKIMRHLGDTKPQLSSVRKAGAGHKEGGVNNKQQVEEDDDEQGNSDDEGEEDDLESQSQSSEGLDPKARQRRRIATFEKNSFRQPKFWFRWQGEVQRTADSDDETSKVHGSGYLVMASNDCKRFQGTITSEVIGWNNVKMTGWKTRPQPERDFEIRWKPS